MEIYKRLLNNRLPGSGSGIEFFGDTILTTADSLIEVFGKPNGGKCEKTKYKWKLETDNEVPFDIYDYKCSDSLESYDKVWFHIGARSGHESSFITELLSNKLEARIKNVYK